MWYGNIETEASRGHICETRVVNLNHSTSPPSIDLPWPLEWWNFASHWGWNLFSELSSSKRQLICRDKKTLISEKVGNLAWKMHSWDPSQWTKRFLNIKQIKFQCWKGSIFSYLLTVRAEGADTLHPLRSPLLIWNKNLKLWKRLQMSRPHQLHKKLLCKFKACFMCI